MSFCPNCTNDDTAIVCEHTAPMTCMECETDDYAVVLDCYCLFCVLEGKVTPRYDYKPRDVVARCLDAVKLGKRRKQLGLYPPTLIAQEYSELYELFMEGYNN